MVLLLVLAAIGLVVAVALRVRWARGRPDALIDPSTLAPPLRARRSGAPGTPSSLTGTAGPTGPAGTRPLAPRPGAVTLPELMMGVTLSDELLPLTHGMSPADMEWRVVLVSAQDTTTVHQQLTDRLEAAGFDVEWAQSTVGRAHRHDGALAIHLHPPVSRELAEQSLSEKERKRVRKTETTPRRPDFPSAPLDATVVELLLD